MGFRPRRSIKILPGVRINLSKSGVSTSVGKLGTTINFSNRPVAGLGSLDPLSKYFIRKDRRPDVQTLC